MAGTKGNSGGQREGSGRPKTQPTIQKQLLFFEDTLLKYHDFKAQYESEQLTLPKKERKPFVQYLNEKLLSIFSVSDVVKTK